jgi:hypothetical protein
MAIPKKISAPSPSCTDWASLLWRSVPLSALPQATLQEHHRDPDAVLAFVKDPERVRAKLRELPAAALAVLDRLIVAGGALDAKLLVSETLLILERSAPDVPVDDCAAAGVIALTEAGLITTAASSAHRRDKAYALVAEAAPVVAAAAYGALLNAEEQPEVPPSRYSDPDTREVLVFAATSAHVALRANQNQARRPRHARQMAAARGRRRSVADAGRPVRAQPRGVARRGTAPDLAGAQDPCHSAPGRRVDLAFRLDERSRLSGLRLALPANVDPRAMAFARRSGRGL